MGGMVKITVKVLWFKVDVGLRVLVYSCLISGYIFFRVLYGEDS